MYWAAYIDSLQQMELPSAPWLAPVIFVLKTFVTSQVSHSLSHAQTRRLSFHQAASTTGLLHFVICAREYTCTHLATWPQAYTHTGTHSFVVCDVNL